MHIVVGLGNPGREYADTRHNVGFMVVKELIRRHDAAAAKSRFRSEITEYFANGAKVVLVAPQTYMNQSGVAVQQVVNWYRADLEHMLVVYDDLDLPFGQLRLRASGSAGGHNGLKSIVQELGTNEVPRLRIGIGRGPGTAVAHVLSRFGPKEAAALPELITRATDVVEQWMADGLLATMNDGNRRLETAPMSEEGK